MDLTARPFLKNTTLKKNLNIQAITHLITHFFTLASTQVQGCISPCILNIYIRVVFK